MIDPCGSPSTERLARRCAGGVGLLWVAIALFGLGLSVSESSATRTPSAEGPRFLTPEIRNGRTIGQIVTPRAHALNQLVIEAESDTSAPPGEVVFEVFDEATTTLVRRVTAAARRVVYDSSFTIRFAPLDSKLRQYRLRVSMPRALEGEGIRLWAYDGRAWEDALLVDETQAFSELAFDARTSPPGGRLLRTLGRSRRGAAHAAVVMALFVLANLSLALLLSVMTCGETKPATSRHQGPRTTS